VELYRRLGRIRALDRLADFRQELVDRFGPLPTTADNLVRETELRILAGRWQLERIHVEDEYAVLTGSNPQQLALLARLRGGLVRLVDDRTVYVPLEEKRPKGSVIADLLKMLLQVG
jgi:transcription-repair coupling factor (superfamily II helicase)